MDKLEDAMSKVTIEMLDSLNYGEEIELNDKYVLSHYCEDECIVLVEVTEWEELFSVLYSTEDKEIIFESLT